VVCTGDTEVTINIVPGEYPNTVFHSNQEIPVGIMTTKDWQKPCKSPYSPYRSSVRQYPRRRASRRVLPRRETRLPRRAPQCTATSTAAGPTGR